MQFVVLATGLPGHVYGPFASVAAAATWAKANLDLVLWHVAPLIKAE